MTAVTIWFSDFFSSWDSCTLKPSGVPHLGLSDKREDTSYIWISNKQLIFKKPCPMQYLGHIYSKHYSLFTWNSKLPRRPVIFIFFFFFLNLETLSAVYKRTGSSIHWFWLFPFSAFFSTISDLSFPLQFQVPLISLWIQVIFPSQMAPFLVSLGLLKRASSRKPSLNTQSKEISCSI